MNQIVTKARYLIRAYKLALKNMHTGEESEMTWTDCCEWAVDEINEIADTNSQHPKRIDDGLHARRCFCVRPLDTLPFKTDENIFADYL